MSEHSTDRRDALVKAVLLLRAKARGRTQALSCFLDEQPSELVPRRGRPGLHLPANDAELIVNPGFLYQMGSTPPDAIRRRALPLDGFVRGYPIAWVEDQGPGIWMPFWARGIWNEVLQALQPGLPIPAACSPAVRRILAMATVLVSRHYPQARRTQWHRLCQNLRAQFRTQGYAIVRDLIHPLQLGAMRRYYRSLVAEGRLPLGDSQVAGRYRLHSEVVASFLHPQLVDLVSRVAGEPVKPSYVYFASYQPGASLPPHLDREQCEFSISLLVDYIPDRDGPCGWPLYMEPPGAPETVGAVDLGVGDAVIYRGRQLIHYRHALPAGHQSTSLFLHYVRENFVGSLW